MNFKKIVLSALFTVLLIYLVSLVVLMLASGGPSNPWQAFDPFYQHDTWLFVFGWSLGYWGYVLMVLLWLLLFWAMYQLINLFFNKHK
jgi:hypothetical protein